MASRTSTRSRRAGKNPVAKARRTGARKSARPAPRPSARTRARAAKRAVKVAKFVAPVYPAVGSPDAGDNPFRTYTANGQTWTSFRPMRSSRKVA